MNSRTYRAVQAVAPHVFEVTERALMEPDPGTVRIRVEACGVCHSDAGPVEAERAPGNPRVPGHEVVGRIDAVGVGVSRPRVRDAFNPWKPHRLGH